MSTQHPLTPFAGIAVAGLAIGLSAAWTGCGKMDDAEKEEPTPKVVLPDCPAKYQLLTGEQRAKSYRCRCSASAMTGAVWGTDIYTTDSSVCAAALHAGAVTNQGGEVELVFAPGCKRYLGTSRNGIRSASWRQYKGSFYFQGKGDGKCFAYKRRGRCPDRYRDLPPEDRKGAWPCTCGKDRFRGSVWGTGIYTADSSICRAALHAGALGPEGGLVTLLPAPGCSRYQGSSTHGVTSRAWAHYRFSFYFKGKGKGHCK